MKRLFIIYSILTYSILLSSTRVAGSFFVHAQTLQRGFVVGGTVPRRQGVGLWPLVQRGGMYRRGDGYLILPDGLGELVTMNYVDGFSLGPHFTAGRMLSDGSRVEVEPTLRYAFGRRVWQGGGALRYILPPERQTWFGVSAGRHSRNFDPDPRLAGSQADMAMSLFGWDHQKFFDLTHAGLTASGPVSDPLLLTASWQWQRRGRLDNHRRRSLFGRRAGANLPSTYRHPGGGDWEADPVLNFGRHETFIYSLRFDYTRGAGVLVVDDMTARTVSMYPTWTLALELSTLPTFNPATRGWVRYERVEAGVKQTIDRAPCHWRYEASAGFFPDRHGMMLADFRHFDASGFAWQATDGLTWFSLLDDYELSTDRWWLEAHGELLHERLWLSRLARIDGLGEYLQAHFLQVPWRAPHTEFSYGVTMGQWMRIGCSVGFDGAHYDGVAFNLILSAAGQ